MIHHHLAADGSFTAGDSETRTTANAKPGTPWADYAALAPVSTARYMLETEADARRFLRVRDQHGVTGLDDTRNWAVLDIEDVRKAPWI